MSEFLNRKVVALHYTPAKNPVVFEHCLSQAQTIYTAYDNPSEKKIQAWKELIAQVEEFCKHRGSSYRISLLHAGAYNFSVILWLEVLPFNVRGQPGSGYAYITHNNCYIKAISKNKQEQEDINAVDESR